MYNIIPAGLWQPEADVQTQELIGLARGEQVGVAELACRRDKMGLTICHTNEIV
jgi:hypothetical protein